MGEDRRPRVPDSLQEPFRSALVAAADVWIEREGLISIVLFGSVARGDFTPDSDIDVLVVTEKLDTDLKWDIWGVGSEVSLEFDVLFNLHVYPRALWESLRAKRKTIWRNVEQDGVELTLKPVPA